MKDIIKIILSNVDKYISIMKLNSMFKPRLNKIKDIDICI